MTDGPLKGEMRESPNVMTFNDNLLRSAFKAGQKVLLFYLN